MGVLTGVVDRDWDISRERKVADPLVIFSRGMCLQFKGVGSLAIDTASVKGE